MQQETQDIHTGSCSKYDARNLVSNVPDAKEASDAARNQVNSDTRRSNDCSKHEIGVVPTYQASIAPGTYYKIRPR